MTAQPSFEDVAEELGIVDSFGETNAFLTIGGVSFVDFNGDGWDDLVFCTKLGQPLRFYQNNNGEFFDLIDPPPVNNTDQQVTVLWADYDNDGDLDLLIISWMAAMQLMRNNGDGTFTDVTAEAGLPLTETRTHGATFGDYDRDGFLDIYITRYWLGIQQDTNSLFRNNGDGTFTDVTTAAGVQDPGESSFCAVFFDYDDDGWDDLYVVNDRCHFPNRLYRNNGDGTFTDVTEISGAGACLDNATCGENSTVRCIDSMNAGIADYDNNGFFDIYVTNVGASFFLENQGDGTFHDVAAETGTMFDRVGWAGTFIDIDHNLHPDLYVCTSMIGNTTPNALYINQGNGTFSEPFGNTGGLGGKDTTKTYTSVIGDINNDGLYDIAVLATYPPGHGPFNNLLWKNTTQTSNHWFKLKLTGTHANRDAFGTWIETWIDGQKYIRQMFSHEGFQGQNSRTLIISAGSATTIDSLVLRWPVKVGNIPYHKQVIPGSEITMMAVNDITEPEICHVVVSPLNDGLGSLRHAIMCAQPGDTVTFDMNTIDTLYLTDESVLIDKDVVIRSDGSTPPVILASMTTAAFVLSENTTLSLENLTLAGAHTIIQNHGVLTLDQTLIVQDGQASKPAILNMGSAQVIGTVHLITD